ncbi:MAG: hypothetical protein SFZ03_07175 [Candidatus Melainabacteria bacterium]|nr:hypothetical protein [Candidatus Melainabacteria bacterium]
MTTLRFGKLLEHSLQQEGNTATARVSYPLPLNRHLSNDYHIQGTVSARGDRFETQLDDPQHGNPAIAIEVDAPDQLALNRREEHFFARPELLVQNLLQPVWRFLFKPDQAAYEPVDPLGSPTSKLGTFFVTQEQLATAEGRFPSVKVEGKRLDLLEPETIAGLVQDSFQLYHRMVAPKTYDADQYRVEGNQLASDDWLPQPEPEKKKQLAVATLTQTLSEARDSLEGMLQL